MSLYTLFHDNKDKVIHKWTHYFSVYERYFNDFRNKSVILFEFGVAKGGSLQMWKKYLGPFAVIVGIDINPTCKEHEDKQCYVRIGNQSDISFMQNIINEFGTPDIVIDDGSHMMNDMITTFNFLYAKLNNNGIYIVEDTHTCYWERYGGGTKNKSSFIEKAKDMIDTMHSFYFLDPTDVPEFAKHTCSICFYDSMVVFEKKIRPEPCALRIGKHN